MLGGCCRQTVNGRPVGGDQNGGPEQVPNDYVQLPTAQDTTSVTLEDIPNMTATVTLTSPAYIHGLLTYTCQTTGVGTDATAAFAVQINAVDGQENQRQLSGTNDRGTGGVQYRSSSQLPAGSYTIKGRFRRVSGDKTVRCTAAQLFAWGLVA